VARSALGLQPVPATPGTDAPNSRRIIASSGVQREKTARAQPLPEMKARRPRRTQPSGSLQPGADLGPHRAYSCQHLCPRMKGPAQSAQQIRMIRPQGANASCGRLKSRARACGLDGAHHHPRPLHQLWPTPSEEGEKAHNIGPVVTKGQRPAQSMRNRSAPRITIPPQRRSHLRHQHGTPITPPASASQTRYLPPTAINSPKTTTVQRTHRPCERRMTRIAFPVRSGPRVASAPHRHGHGPAAALPPCKATIGISSRQATICWIVSQRRRSPSEARIAVSRFTNSQTACPWRLQGW